MTPTPMAIGKRVTNVETRPVSGNYVELAGERYYQIANYDQMAPFFMSVVSDSNHWLFLSSTGGLTAGRRNPDNALFPYYTDDKIHDAADLTGSKTVVLVTRTGTTFLWEPFIAAGPRLYAVRRNIYKSFLGNKVVFEEINEDLDITFFTGWSSSDRFGFVRHSCVVNNAAEPVSVEILDGVQNLLPYGIESRMQSQFSTLLDGYKKNELLTDCGLGLYTLSSIPVDSPEPSEALKATVVYALGLHNSTHLLSVSQVERFKRGLPITEEHDVRAARGAYLVSISSELQPGTPQDWYLVADLEQDAADVVRLRQLLATPQELLTSVLEDVAAGSNRLSRLIATADGNQTSADELSTARHHSNVLYNIMRGGIFEHGYTLDTADFLRFIKGVNTNIATEYEQLWDGLPPTVEYAELVELGRQQRCPDLVRLISEYLPLSFSRRHGDPSRPWNQFSIETKNEDGSALLDYQGNWRDIFQNWEALSLSFPCYLEGMVAKFLNATTPDGYNPYRITRSGIDWEVIDPDDPWSNIGYWGDHQIIYLCKLLELTHRHFPGMLEDKLTRAVYSYANLPYRIKPYQELLVTPKATIDFDEELEATIRQRVAALGADGRLVWDNADRVYHANLSEKLLVPVLAKLSNFIPEAGIWMNTQRPEWNDANNALVGFGVSMVTLYYLRRHLVLCCQLFASPAATATSLSEEVATWLSATTTALLDHQTLLNGSITDEDRRSVLDLLGTAGSDYRATIYTRGFSGQHRQVAFSELASFCDLVVRFLDHSIHASRRPDGLYHAYNLICIGEDTLSIRHLPEMLEGQVAVLSSQELSASEALALLVSLRDSALYREDQNSYILYPDRQLPRFVEKNNLTPAQWQRSRLLRSLLDDGNRRIVVKDINGGVHFNGAFRNAAMLEHALLELDEHREMAREERALVLELWEEVFDHQSFTGRSGTFYKYEGLGCIYWHMVSKLALAVAEVFHDAVADGESDELLAKLKHRYYQVREGIGAHKSPDEYGAFPTDAYSHTPGYAGVQQPGLTGQVKEDILSRFAELGVVVNNGKLSFTPKLLRQSELLTTQAELVFTDTAARQQTLTLEAGTLAFTYCQVPIVYRFADRPSLTLVRADESHTTQAGSTLDTTTSASVFSRRCEVARIEVCLVLPQDDLS